MKLVPTASKPLLEHGDPVVDLIAVETKRE
jgi:hypothetical protein